ncbi:MAG: hypothetical protein ACYTGZ_11405 [Planctomycetota bacterium]|jgi:hypothetical protein
MARIVLLALGGFLLSGCVLTAIGIGVYADTQYKQGVGTQDFKAPIQETWDACLAALDEFDVSYDKSVKLDPEKGTKLHVKGREGEGWVEVKPHPEQEAYTRVRARGHGSNRDKKKQAYQLLDSVDARLGGAGDIG